MTLQLMDRGALFSKDRTHRHLLWRVWDNGLPLLCMVMLNPSKAGETESDPTVSRQMERAGLMGCGGLLVVNAYDLVATDPKDMLCHPRPITDACNPHLIDAARRAHESGGKVIVGWGKHITGRRQSEITQMLKDIPLWCLGKNKDGSPKHPLYVSYETAPVRWP